MEEIKLKTDEEVIKYAKERKKLIINEKEHPNLIKHFRKELFLDEKYKDIPY